VARMIELLHKSKQPLNKVLEIGTGCGYQAAVLSLLANEVYSIERIRPLHDLARDNLRPFRIKNLRLIYGDGILGLPQAAPFDSIILAAAKSCSGRMRSIEYTSFAKRLRTAA